MPLYTRTGDDGTTGLHGGNRVKKTCSRVTAYGETDELNAALGLCRAACDPARDGVIHTPIEEMQAFLFEIGADLATLPDSRAQKKLAPVTAADIARMEMWIDESEADVPKLKAFILPGGTELSARLHLARTIARRAERAVLHLAEDDGDGGSVALETIAWLNRASDLLFALARRANHLADVADIQWQPRGEKSG